MLAKEPQGSDVRVAVIRTSPIVALRARVGIVDVVQRASPMRRGAQASKAEGMETDLSVIATASALAQETAESATTRTRTDKDQYRISATNQTFHLLPLERVT